MFSDAHNDTLTKTFFKNESLEENSCQFDFKRADSIGLKLQYMAIWQDTRNQNADFLKNIFDVLEYLNMYDINNIGVTKKFVLEKINVLVSIEDISFIKDLDSIEVLKSKGVMSATLSWNHKNNLCGGAYEDEGLTQFGIHVLKKLRECNFLIDLAHMGKKSFYEIIGYLDSPFIVSHSNCYTLCRSKRNLTDEQIRIVGELNGLIGVNFYSEFLSQDTATIEDIAKHIAHISQMIGHEHVCFGSDFDGADIYPTGLDGVESLPKLRRILLKYGFSEQEIDDICYNNLKRFTAQFLK